MDLTQVMLDLFGPYGGPGVILMVFLAFLLDATLVPFLPEIFIILGYSYNPEPSFAITLILVSILAEWAGNCILYLLVKHIRVPRRIRSVVNRYIGIMVVSDERMLLINRIAPLIPYSGAFIALVDGWRLSRALFYIALGCVLKYGLILSMSTVFYSYFSGGMASIMTIVLVVIMLVLSLILSYVRKRRVLSDNQKCVEE